MRPTGSGDPFALRRAALGFSQITLSSAVRIPLVPLLHSSWPPKAVTRGGGAGTRAAGTGASGAGPAAAQPLDLLAFFHDRLKVYLKDKGHRYDAIDAVLTKADGSLEDDLVLIVMKLEALEAFLKTEDGANLAAGFKRAANILKAEEKKGALPDALNVSESALQQAEEKSLFAALKSVEGTAAAAVAAEKFADAMTALAALRAPIDAFFDKVTVNADDPALRANRLALLKRFVAATASVADLSKLEG